MKPPTYCWMSPQRVALVLHGASGAGIGDKIGDHFKVASKSFTLDTQTGAPMFRMTTRTYNSLRTLALEQAGLVENFDMNALFDCNERDPFDPCHKHVDI